MKKVVLITLIFIGISTGLRAADGIAQTRKAAMGVIERFTNGDQPKIRLVEISRSEDRNVYEYAVTRGVITIKGSSGVAWCRGFYDMVKAHDAGICSWSGARCELSKLPTDIAAERRTALFRHYFYFNPVTYGYTMPYWDWARWEREIDWMALHGIDMPLALVANEAISARVWKQMGLTDKEIRDYFTGPAHLPWMRMGNASAIDPGLTEEWHRGQIELQHRILGRMQALGMKPICPGFAGMVPRAFQRLYPNLKLIETNWVGFRNWMIDPNDELFAELGKRFIEEWEKEFGKCDYYLADSFNEMELPFHAHGDARRYEQLASYGENVYNAIKAGNPDAVWVMQGWMFGYQRNIWDTRSLQALLSRVPDDRMLLLDLAVDYNKNFWHNGANWDYYEGFYGKPWVYSTIPNMGGKTGPTGMLAFYANGHLEALNSPNRGLLVGYGTAPEGIENNEVIYELIADAGWSPTEIDLGKWLQQYSKCRYGDCPEEIVQSWDGLLHSVYGSFTDHPRFNWQFRPGTVRVGSITINDALFAGIEAFGSVADRFAKSPLYCADLLEYTALYVGSKLEILARQIYTCYDYAQPDKAEALEKLFCKLMLGMDRMLESHPDRRFSQWLDRARTSSSTPAMQDYYEKNARRLLTVWGPPINDYAARIWSGLIRDYYLPRWELYFASCRNGEPIAWEEWERRWVEERRGLSVVAKSEDPVALALNLIALAKPVSADSLKESAKVIGSWSSGEVSPKPKNMTFPVSSNQLRRMKAIKFQYLQGSDKLMIHRVEIVADGNTIVSLAQEGETGLQDRNNIYLVDLPKDIMGNNECLVRAVVSSSNNGDSNGVVQLITALN